MNIHEYQAKELLRHYGVKTLRGELAESPEQALKASKNLGGSVWVLKAQVHAGGRGKGGGIQFARSFNEIKTISKNMFQQKLITKQTGAEGKVIHKILVEEGANIEQEYYFAILVDRSSKKIVLIGSSEGGTDIEELAKKEPDKVHKIFVDPTKGLQTFQARNLAFACNIKSSLISKAIRTFSSLYEVFVRKDCSLLEINPLIQTKKDELIVLDAKMVFDDNALYRQKDIEKLKDPKEENSTEVEAHQKGLAFVKLDGSIGCLVNGAGLAMATMDVIKFYGGFPANFLDVGGGATQEKVEAAFDFILRDPQVKGILVNIFGGIMRCDVVARGLVEAFKKFKTQVPLVIRLEGTNKELGEKVIKESRLNMTSAQSLSDAAQKIVSAVQK